MYANQFVVDTILSNILSNVEKHGAAASGVFQARVTVDDVALVVSNQKNTLPAEARPEYGFGLEINEKLCAAIGWRFTTLQDDEDFSVKIAFT